MVELTEVCSEFSSEAMKGLGSVKQGQMGRMWAHMVSREWH